MGFLGVMLKIISILAMLADTVFCTAVAMYYEEVDVYIFMGCVWAAVMLIALAVWGTGKALTEVCKMRKKLEKLENRLLKLATAPAVPAAPPAPAAPAAPEAPEAQMDLEAEIITELFGEQPAAPAAAPAPRQKTFRKKKSQGKVWIPVAVIAVVVIVGAVLAFTLLGDKDDKTPAVYDGSQDSAVVEAASNAEGVSLFLGDVIETENFRMTLESMELAEEYVIRTGSNSTLSLYVEDGYQLLMLKGHFTNTGTAAIADSSFSFSALVNGTYAVDGYDVRLCFERSKSFEIDPYTDLDYVLYINIPDKLAQVYETATFTLRFNDDMSMPATIWNMDGTTAVEADNIYSVTGGQGSAAPQAPAAEAPAATEAPAMAAGNVTIDAIAVDDSYQDKDGAPLKLVYLFYTVDAQDSNMQVDSKGTVMTINNANSYTSEHRPNVADYAPSYYSSTYLQDIYLGTELKVVTTFKIPEADLAPGRSITLSDNQVSGMDKLRLSTDSIQHFADVQDLCMAIDPQGYEEAVYAREPADNQTAQKVKNLINGYYWSFYVNNISYQIEFFSGNRYELRTAFGTTGGSYQVTNRYITVTNSGTGAVNEIPYTLGNGSIDLDVADGFDVKQN